MTDLLDRPTEERTDLLSERWEVETSVPVAITAPLDGPDFVIMSHAEQAPGDFPVEMGQASQLYFQLRDFARDELGLVAVAGGILFNPRGTPAFSHGDAGFSWAESGFGSLRALLAAFAEQSSEIRRMEQRRIVEEILEQFPVPIFGSPPNGWAGLAQLASQGSLVAMAGYAHWTDQPVLAVIGGGTALLIWFVKPLAKVVRRSVAERLAAKLGTQLRPEDEG